MPYIDLVIQKRIRQFGRTEFESAKDKADFEKHKDDMPVGTILTTPLMGGSVWMGEQDAIEATVEMIEMADRVGKLRDMFEAIRANRIDDDFSERWSFEREDFERKMYCKRNKIKVRFVQLDDTIPVHGPHSEIDEQLLWDDLFSAVDQKERQIVVCLRNGITRAADIASTLGYANHSPVSKKLKRIRAKAKKLFEI
jgi:hypothetical protein